MKTLSNRDRLWIARGMAIGHWLNALFEGIAKFGYRSFRQRLRDKDHDRSRWKATVR